MDGRYDFSVEKRVTDTYIRFRSAHTAIRELRCLEQMYPAILLPLRPNDRIAGRIRMSLIGFSPEPGGLGYYCDESAILRILEQHSDALQDAEVHKILEFWRNECTSAKVRAAYPSEVLRALPSDNWISEPLAAAPLYRMAGTYLDFGKLLRLGIGGLRQLIREKSDTTALYEAMDGALQLLSRCCLYYRDQALALGEMTELAQALEHISVERPRTMLEAIQLMWLYILLSGTFNYGRLDVLLGDYLAEDLKLGRLTRESAQELLNEFWRVMDERRTTWNGRVILGGLGRRNEKNADRFALMAMEASRVVKEAEPQLTLRIYEGMDPKLIEKALQVLAEGRTYPMLYNDDVNIPAVAHAFRLSREEAAQYVPFGCGEYVIDHKSVGSPNGIINLLKILELTLHNGRDAVTGVQLGPETGRFEAMDSFEELWDAYCTQSRFFVEALARQEAIEYRVTGEQAPFLLLSILYDDCLERGKGIFSGGVRYLGGTLETYGNINTADSLTAIRQLVFEQARFTKQELLKMLDCNFEGFSDECALLQGAPKYGNDDPIADEMAVRVHEHICKLVREQARRVGLHSYLVVIINNSANTTLGRLTAASADGRGAGMYMANANNPYSGNDKKGLTAMLNSLVKLRPEIHAGAVQNLKLSPELFGGDGAIVKSMLKTYFEKGGTQAMISVVRRAELEQAMEHPERYGHLFVRVGGFSARFVELEKDVQLEILNRTLY